MEETIKKIEKAVMNDLLPNLAQSCSGNKSAAARARKASLELEKLLKEYRKQSIEAAKK